MSPALRRVLTTLTALAVLGLLAAPAAAQSFPAAPKDETTFSLGKAIIWVHPNHVNLVSHLPGWEQDEPGHFSTPYMFDFQTTIGVSAAHYDGSFTDHDGTTVGSAGTTVADSNFTLHPGEGPVDRREIHTELYRMILEQPPLCNGAFEIRAGTGAGVGFPSFGEVEALQFGSDFPAESFFQVYVEIQTPFGTLYNIDPLMIRHPSINSLPPKVVYIHGLTPAVRVFFQSGPYAGQLFGKLRLAGHGLSDPDRCPNPCGTQPSDCPAREELQEALENAPLMSCTNSDTEPQPRPTEDAPFEPADTRIDEEGTVVISPSPTPTPVDECNIIVADDPLPVEPTQN